ncbi:MAG: LytTR family DNA-binding domain-containing protein [Acidobacteriota bacterium]
MSPLRVLIVDDEPLARETLQQMVSEIPELTLVGEARDGQEALIAIANRRPDIVLLDIEMPGSSGLATAEALRQGALPVFIFVTAYDAYACQAFEVEALDYVLKPVSEERLQRALERARQRVLEHQLREAAQRLTTPATRPPAPTATYLERIPIRNQGRSRLVETRELLWIESQDYYVRLHTRRGSPLLRTTLSALTERLDPQRFLRIHRGAVVNLEEVVEVQNLFRGRRRLVLRDGTELMVSRSRRQAVEQALLPKLRP